MMPDPQDYTIGWVCAVNKELIAARAFLDEDHGDVDFLPADDNNNYVLCRTGKHNVVIAVLPHWEYGLVNAANVARDMIRSFPNLRVGFMVGIGGGAPAKHNIRLGDVVVSSAGYGNGGVFQYDYGMTLQNKAFVARGFLNKPPTFIMTAVAALKATYQMNGHQFQAAIASVLNKFPKLQHEFQRPAASTDRLYRPDVIHIADNSESCVTSCGDDESKLILRSTRSAYEDDPTIHYGLIASANQLMQDASIRDTLSREKDVLCFETEAAGLMNQFPFLIVRGICDYSDTHKNLQWQGYAAMTAAAYTKDLLYKIPPNKVEAERRLCEILSDVSSTLYSVNEDTTHIRHHLDKKEDLEIFDWLIPTDYGSQQTDYLRRRQPGTGKWLLDSRQYQNWIQESSKTMFCPGIPGAGKTIMTSIVIDDLGNRSRSMTTTAVAYIYCNYKRQSEQTLESLLSSLLKQLARSQPSLPSSLKELYNRHNIGQTKPSVDEILRVLESVSLQNSRVFIIVDALDECQALDGCRTKFLSAIFNLQKKTGVNIFATSRSIPEISDQFQESLSIEIRATKDDISRYLQGRILELRKFVIDRPDLQNEITTSITEAVDGMFLLAQLHFASLIGKDTTTAIRKALQKLATGPNAYDTAYKHAMERIEEQLQEQAKRAKEVLSWITYAKRPLTKLELQHALAVETNEPELDEDNLLQIEDVVSVCAGLVTVDEESSIVRLVHYTTQDYFVRTQSEWFPDAQLSITTVCTTYLSYQNFANGYCQTAEELEERLRLHHLYDYAACNWGHHGREVSTCQNIVSFLRKTAEVEASSQALLINKRYRYNDYSQNTPRGMTGLHLAAYFGLHKVVATILRDCNADARDSEGRTPLSWAAGNGNEAVVRLLLATEGVNPDSRDEGDQTPLSWATANRDEAVVRLLLNTKGVNPSSKDKAGQTPLSWAAENGNEAVVRLLLATEGVNPDSKDNDDQTPLFWAAWRGREAVVSLLLVTEGVNPDSKNKDGQTPLLWAAEREHEAVTKLLLAIEGVDPNLKDKAGWRPLSWAAASGNKGIVRLLLTNKKVDPGLEDKDGWTPLLWAAIGGDEAIVELLLATKRVDPDLKDKDGRAPLSWAAERGHEAVVRLLLATKRVDPDLKDKDGRAPLSWAAEKGHEAVVRLLKESADLDAVDAARVTTL